MNIKSYAFRLTMAAIAFLMGFSAYRGLQKVDQFLTFTWFDTVKRIIRFQSQDTSTRRPAVCGRGALCNFTGEYYLSEERFPSGFTDFNHIELLEASGNYTGTVYAGQPYRIRTIATDADSLAFETAGNGGVSYRFTGRLRQAGERDGSLHESRAGDIVGKLEKVQNGTITASMQTTFYLFGR